MQKDCFSAIIANEFRGLFARRGVEGHHNGTRSFLRESLATPLPIPDAAPVTMATLPERRNTILEGFANYENLYDIGGLQHG